MKHSLIILISLLLLSSPLYGDNHKGETLYGWGESWLDYKWMGFGDKETHPKYTGQVKDGKPNGLGILTDDPNEITYIGEWKNGLEDGQGKWERKYPLINKINRYDGEWKNGLEDGQGLYTEADYFLYVGEFKNGEMHGQGTMSFYNGAKTDGMFLYGSAWNATTYDRDGNIILDLVNGMVKELWFSLMDKSLWG